MALSNLVTYDLMVGELALDLLKSNTQTFFNSLVTQKQSEILINLLGVTLYKSLYDDGGTNAPYSTLVNGESGGYYAGTDGKYYEFKGIKEMLKYFLYYWYCRHSQSFNTELGERSSGTNNAADVMNLNYKLLVIYNKGIKMYNETIDYINFKNSSTETYADFDPTYLSEFNGI